MFRDYRTTAKDREARFKQRNMAASGEELGIQPIDGTNENESNVTEQTEIAHTQEELNAQASLLKRLPISTFKSAEEYRNAIKSWNSPPRTNLNTHMVINDNADAKLVFTPKQFADQSTLSQSSLTKTNRTVVMELIRGLSVCTGAQELDLLQFLRQVQTIFSLAGNCDHEVMRLILPKTGAFLFNIWLSGVQNNHSWKQLHSDILNNFFPQSQKHRIITNYVYRLQAPTENIIDYIQNITDTISILQVTLSEKETIDIILSNISPSNKRHLTLVNKPSTLLELRQLATHINFSILNEQSYNRQFFHQPQQVFPQTYNNYSGNPHRRQGPRCFHCNRHGHLAAMCRFSEN